MVKCADCGYLSVRNKIDNHLGEAAIDFREKGAVAQGSDEQGRNQHPLHELMPLCFARQPYLRDASKQIDKQKNQNDEVKRIINQEIGETCNEFTPWQQGLTPKEHREMIDRERMLRMEDERRRNDRKWHWIELGILVVGAGLFTLLGAWIAKGS